MLNFAEILNEVAAHIGKQLESTFCLIIFQCHKIGFEKNKTACLF